MATGKKELEAQNAIKSNKIQTSITTSVSEREKEDRRRGKKELEAQNTIKPKRQLQRVSRVPRVEVTRSD